MLENLDANGTIKDLSIYLDTIISDVKHILLINLEDEGNSSFLEEFFIAFKRKEVWFYTTVINKLKEYVGETSDEEFYLFFDIDETIVSNDLETHQDVVRPSLKPLLQTLRSYYPYIHFSICSGRGQEAIWTFIESNIDYWFEEGISSRAMPFEAPDNTWGENCTHWHYNKAHVMISISAQYTPLKCILVDDVIESSFEEKKMWISVRDFVFTGYPKL